MSVRKTLVILTYNEIEATPKVWGSIPLAAADEVFCVDGGSTDGTIEFVRSKGVRVVVQDRRGRGRGFQLGVQEAAGEHIVFFSTDGNEDPADISRMFDLLAEGHDMVIASRMMPGAFNEEDVGWWRPRKWVNNAFTLGANLLFNRRAYVTDTINGYRGVSKQAFERMGIDVDGFDVEFTMSIRAMKLGLRIAEFPTREGARVGGVSTAESWKTGVQFIKRFAHEMRIGGRFGPAAAASR
ncbi:MAG: glycosyltransferase family 2 protein [Elusimicrobia bacterium]|nr:glycosyltransferase family 2 protein [Elusimicrobiota bacterium]